MTVAKRFSKQFDRTLKVHRQQHIVLPTTRSYSQMFKSKPQSFGKTVAKITSGKAPGSGSREARGSRRRRYGR